ncbi:hypothetical protein Pla8534_02120 [Lignipirellula cremea]|uniref:Planctomycete cytochrome C n=2 Tax=Lignipirellula cremea TaxID=2528010 RepID=A0A518DKU8_9BACT|nr:hypothetical protein Pla8534_02120 [Lignipirellula cremea]
MVPEPIQGIITTRCLDCHSGETAEADVRFDNLATLTLNAQLELFNRAQDQLFFGLMPPEDADPLSGIEHAELAGWLRRELRSRHASKLDDKLRDPSYGNYVDHEQLFNGSIRDKPFTPARRWLVSPQIFHERVNAVFQLRERDRQRNFYGVTNPIVLPDHSGVRYYDTAALDGGHLLVMLNNAQWIAEKQVFAAAHQGEDRRQLQFANEKDRWCPPTSPPEFVAILQKQSTPSDEELISAIHAQFDCVLQRRASAAELTKHLPQFRSAIELAGNEDGLRQMLLSVLLKSEFLYRLEFGAGEPDEYGRKKLSPREASYAIAYAVSDRVPDEQLVQAAAEGRLLSKEDYRREVTRLLDDKKSFSDEGDPTLNGIHLRSHTVSHPKINRFFREFFGYPASVKLFKDVSRSGGFFDNAGRDYTGTAGSVTNEADRIVDYILSQDRDVFAQLLTTDLNFVLHTRSNEQGQKLVDGWRRAYEGLKDTEWKDNPEQVLLENFDKHKELFAQIGITDLREDRRKNHVRDLSRYMLFFEHTFGKGRTPITFPWFAHGGQKFRYSEIYSLPPVPGAGPLDYQGRRSRGQYDDEETWDYPVVQPFRIPHRKGLLTHPAWLLAHSQNTETDPVRRGRWIREKLLAGRVPDVPITVDAQIPEDHQRTLRERLDSVTLKQECWKCHQQMNPLGLTFEIFDDFGRYRTHESLELPDSLKETAAGKNTANVSTTKPVNAVGLLRGAGDPALDGEVTDAFDLIDRLAKSDLVRQSIIRHAFRYFMGRNETLSDSQTLIDADQAYIKSGGSFRAVIVSLLTSDSFMYRKNIELR